MLIYSVTLAIFIVTFLGILTEKLHRGIIGISGAVLMVSFGTWMHFYDQAKAIKAIDFQTLGLLLGMMLLVGMLKTTGFFEYLALLTAQMSKGDPWKLLLYLGAITSLLSMFLDNVTTIILIAPVTLHIATNLELNPRPYLLAEALLSNIGGIATLVGDPPNILIASASKLSFSDFLIYLAPLVAVIWVVSLFILKRVFRSDLQAKAANLEQLLMQEPARFIKDSGNLSKILIVLGLVVVFFFLHHLLHISPALVALAGVALALVWIKPDFDETLKQVEWSVLLFFACLFVVVGGLEASGLLSILANALVSFAGYNLLLTALILIWASAVASALVDNIPFTMAMLPVIMHLQQQGISCEPLWWALALGVGLGGNATAIGATANVVVVSLSEKNGTPISFKYWMKSGLVVAAVSCLTASLLFLVAYLYM